MYSPPFKDLSAVNYFINKAFHMLAIIFFLSEDSLQKVSEIYDNNLHVSNMITEVFYNFLNIYKELYT